MQNLHKECEDNHKIKWLIRRPRQPLDIDNQPELNLLSGLPDHGRTLEVEALARQEEQGIQDHPRVAQGLRNDRVQLHYKTIELRNIQRKLAIQQAKDPQV